MGWSINYQGLEQTILWKLLFGVGADPRYIIAVRDYMTAHWRCLFDRRRRHFDAFAKVPLKGARRFRLWWRSCWSFKIWFQASENIAGSNKLRWLQPHSNKTEETYFTMKKDITVRQQKLQEYKTCCFSAVRYRYENKSVATRYIFSRARFLCSWLFQNWYSLPVASFAWRFPSRY